MALITADQSLYLEILSLLCFETPSSPFMVFLPPTLLVVLFKFSELVPPILTSFSMVECPEFQVLDLFFLVIQIDSLNDLSRSRAPKTIAELCYKLSCAFPKLIN